MALSMQCKTVFCRTLQEIIVVLDGPRDGVELGRVNRRQGHWWQLWLDGMDMPCTFWGLGAGRDS
jgi:hypothetical protein